MRKVYYHLMLTGEADRLDHASVILYSARLLLLIHICDGGTFSNVKPHQLLPFVHVPADEMNECLQLN